MSWRQWPLRWSGRWMVPLGLFVFAVLIMGLRWQMEALSIEADVTAQESRRLQERLGVEQYRLDAEMASGNQLLLRRLVSGLALHQGLSEAYLVDPQGLVLAALSRRDLGQSLDGLALSAGLAARIQAPSTHALHESAIEVARAAGSPALVAKVPLFSGARLWVSLDMRFALAKRKALMHKDLAREAGLIALALLLLAAMLHRLWFRRAERLARALSDMGKGRLHTRVGLSGRDELARVGWAANQMAARLEQDQAQIQRMHEIVNRACLVLVEWSLESGWPLHYVSDAVRQWGWDAERVSEGPWLFKEWIHPEDVDRVESALRQGMAGFAQRWSLRYRVRRIDGDWAWVEDSSSLEVSADLSQASVSAVLRDITTQVQIQESQREQEELLALFYEMPFIGMAISSPLDKRWLQVNDRLCEILGYSREDLLQLTWSEITEPEDLNKNLELFDDLLAGQRQGYQLRKRFVRPDGQRVFTEIDVRAVYSAQGTVRHLFTTIQDVSERHHAETAMQQSAAQLREAQRVGRMGSWEHCLTTGRHSWSGEMFALHALDLARTTPGLSALLERVHPDELPRVRAAYQNAVGEGRAFELSYRIQWPDGGVGHLRARGVVESGHGGARRVLGTVQDVTDLVTAQQERDRLASVLENTTDIVSMADAHGEVFFFNRAGYQQLGLSQDQPLSDVIARVHPPWASQRVLEEGIPAAIREGRWLGVTAVYNAQGQEVPMSQLIMAHHDEAGQLQHVWTILRDISERIRSERALEEARALLEQRVAERTSQLQQANQELQAFSYTVSHDLKAPLRGIDGYSQLLMEEHQDQLDAEGLHFLQRIREGVAHMSELIADLLAYSRIEQLDMAREPIDLAKLVAQVLAGYQAECEGSGAQVRLDLGQQIWLLNKDGLSLVLRNLLGNALKFTRPGERPDIEVGASAESGRRMLWVRDHGVGFDMKYHDRIFGIFQRLHRVDEFPGTGVGLALVAKAVQRMGGRVWAESQLGRGSTFYLEFPA